MSTNHTKNYDLCQWEAGDKVLRTDFNDDNAKLDTVLARIDATATRADTAAAAAYNLDSPGFVIGRYSGQVASTDSNWREVNLGFQPRAVLVWPENGGITTTSGGSGVTFAYGGLAIRAAISDSNYPGVKISTNGFTVRNYESNGTGVIYKRLNTTGRTYCYIAFR